MKITNKTFRYKNTNKTFRYKNTSDINTCTLIPFTWLNKVNNLNLA